MSPELAFPVAVETLSGFLPHRAPALWVDEVSSVTETDGVCRVRISAGAHYCDALGRVRDSSFVEWIAQSYGFVAACQILCGLAKDEKRPQKTFLVQVRELELHSPVLEDGDWVSVRVKRTHKLGPLALIEGEVLSSSEQLLAQAKLKLYAE